MSVILDALKRVQDENHRRGTGPADHHEETVRDADTMVERLNARPPESDFVAEPRRLSPVVWVAIIALGSAAVIVTALWWFEPDFTGSSANSGSPLLTQLRSETPSTARPVGETTPTPVPMSAGDEARVEERVAAPAAPVEVPAGDDLSDLSSSVPAATEANQPVVRDEPPAFDLTVRQRAEPAPAEESPTFHLSTSSARDSEPAPEVRQPAAREDRAAYDNPFAARERESEVASVHNETLVDPGVKSGFERGLQLQKAGDLGGAEDAYLRALKLDPTNSKINANLAVLYEAQGRFGLAERHLRDALNVDPNNAAARNNLGVILYRMGSFDAAMIEFNRTLAIDPEQLDAYTNKGLIFMRWGRYDEARRAFAQVLVMDPQNALAHYNLGLVYEEMQEWGLAIDSYGRFLEAGSAAHPDVVQYVSQRLPWVEARLLDGGR